MSPVTWWFRVISIDNEEKIPKKRDKIAFCFSIIWGIKNIIEIKKRESWGIRNLAYKINKNRKGHYMLLNIEGPPEAIQEYERLMRLDEDIIRFLTIKIKSIDEKPSPLMVNNSDRSKNETNKDENFSAPDNE